MPGTDSFHQECPCLRVPNGARGVHHNLAPVIPTSINIHNRHLGRVGEIIIINIRRFIPFIPIRTHFLNTTAYTPAAVYLLLECCSYLYFDQRDINIYSLPQRATQYEVLPRRYPNSRFRHRSLGGELERIRSDPPPLSPPESGAAVECGQGC